MSPERAADVALASVRECQQRDPKAPALSHADAVVCQGARRNAAIAASCGSIATSDAGCK